MTSPVLHIPGRCESYAEHDIFARDFPGMTNQWKVQLIGGFGLFRNDEPLSTSGAAQRLIAYLALHERPSRSMIAAGLWPESPEEHALSNLRTTTSRLRRSTTDLLTPPAEPLGLARAVRVDLGDVLAATHAAGDASDPAGLARVLAHGGELLPGWYEDWVLFEREQLQQDLITALEVLAERLLNTGEVTAAGVAATASIRREPLRESSHRLLVRVRLAEGNRVEAWRAYERFRRRSIAEVGLAPDNSFEELVAELARERQRRRRP